MKVTLEELRKHRNPATAPQPLRTFPTGEHFGQFNTEQGHLSEFFHATPTQRAVHLMEHHNIQGSGVKRADSVSQSNYHRYLHLNKPKQFGVKRGLVEGAGTRMMESMK